MSSSSAAKKDVTFHNTKAGIERVASADSASLPPPPPPPLPPSESIDDVSSVGSMPPPPPPPPRAEEDYDVGFTKCLDELETPAFVINRHAFAQNCKVVSEHAKKRNLSLRPHIKTHKTIEGAWVQAHGLPFEDEEPINGATVSGFVASTLPEVALLVQAASDFGEPFCDVLFGIPISKSKLGELYKMKMKLRELVKGNVHIMMDHLGQVEMVEQFLKQARSKEPFSVFVKLDTGYHRAGITCDERGVKLAEQIIASPLLKLHGVYSHCGHAYNVKDPMELAEIAKFDIDQIASFLKSLQLHLDSEGLVTSVNDLVVSVGSTPTVFHHYRLDGIQNMEIHPGNYTLFDRQQLWTGACREESQIAGRVLARVIGHYEDRNTIMLDAGATALTKETAPQDSDWCTIDGFPELSCFKMSQEVTLVRPKDETAAFPFDKLPLGALVNLIPNHSCLAAACFEKYHVIDDASCLFKPSEVVVEEWIPCKGFEG